MDMNLDIFGNFHPGQVTRSKDLLRQYVIILMIAVTPLFFLGFINQNNLNQVSSPLTDLTILLRFCVSLPLFMLTLKVTGAELKNIINHFIEASIIRTQDYPKFKDIIQVTLSCRDSKKIKLVILIFIYTSQFFIGLETLDHPESWRTMNSSSGSSISYAGYWFYLVAQPIFYFFMLNTIFRISLWWNFIFKIRKLNLQLNASHGDGSGGLAFLGLSLKAFMLPALAISSSMAAGALNVFTLQVPHEIEMKFIILILTGISLFYFAGPLFLFAPKLLKLKTAAILQYGTLSRNQLKGFENKWIRSRKKRPNDYLACSDFSSTTDLNSVVNRVMTMKIIPFQNKEIFLLMLAILLPFLPIAGLGINWKTVFKQILKLVL